ncbi:hypothetical protein OIU78_023921 [Salix suchowensis]|nr:hypothetical protein OIU78_023921 [Salix suchowensis]
MLVRFNNIQQYQTLLLPQQFFPSRVLDGSITLERKGLLTFEGGGLSTMLEKFKQIREAKVHKVKSFKNSYFWSWCMDYLRLTSEIPWRDPSV